MKDLDFDDYIAAQVVSRFRDISKEYPTTTQITACFNIICGLLNLCSVRNEKETLIKLAEKFHNGMIDHIEDIYKE